MIPVDALLAAVGVVLILIAPTYLSYHLARRKGRRQLRWAAGACAAALLGVGMGLLLGGWFVVAALAVLPTPDLHPDV